MATNDPTVEQFNDLGVSAPIPGDNSTYAPPDGPQAPYAEPEPEVPTGEPAPDPRQIIDEFIEGDAKAAKNQTFAQKRRQAEIEMEAQKAQTRAEYERVQGLAEFAQVLDQNPEFAQKVGQLYQEEINGGAAVAPQPYSRPAASNAATPQTSEEMVQLRQQVADLSRGLMKHSIQAATNIVQGRYQLNQEDLAAVVVTAVANGFLHPGMSQSDVETQLENARKIAFFERAKAQGKSELLERVDRKQQAVTAQGAAGGEMVRKAYDVRGKSFAEIRRDAKLAGSKGL